MTKRDSFLLRISPEVLDAVRQWADDEFRSVNAQIEMLLRGALKNSGRDPKKDKMGPASTTNNSDPNAPSPSN